MPTYPTYKLGEVADILDSFRKPINSTERTKKIQDKKENELYPYYGATGQVGLIDEYLTDGEYVLVGEDGAPFLEPFKKKSYIIQGKAWVNNHAHILSGKKDVLSNQYLNYFLNSFDYRNYVNGTTRLKLTQGNLTQIPIPLPTLSTQYAIVSRIESLFAELDKAEEHLRTARQQLKTYRQAVLNHWLNNEDGKWETVKLKDICISISDGDHLPPKRTTKGIPFITISDIKGNSVDFSNVSYMTEEYYGNLTPSRKAQKGDILYTVTGSFGIPVLVDNSQKFCFQRHIGLLRPDSNLVVQRWLYYMMQSPIVYSQASEKATGTAQKTVTLTVLRDFDISLPPLSEQQRIVEEIETRLSQAEAAEVRIAEALQKTEALRQSILKKAFSGELV